MEERHNVTLNCGTRLSQKSKICTPHVIEIASTVATSGEAYLYWFFTNAPRLSRLDFHPAAMRQYRSAVCGAVCGVPEIRDCRLRNCIFNTSHENSATEKDLG
jgi:hypothetical protein